VNTQFAEQYLKQRPSMVSKMFRGVAKSEPVLKAVAQFILDTELNIGQYEQFKEQAMRVINR
jgi:hypothetical protein